MPLSKSDFISEFQSICNSVARTHAAVVDVQARFPHESINALKTIAALSAGNSEHLKGLALNILEQAELCNALARSCASSAMILGMHYIKCNALNRWAQQQAFFQDYLQACVTHPRLIASMTSEEGLGGDLRQSHAALIAKDSLLQISKSSPCLSYVNEADDILLTCRVNEDAASSDQVLVLVNKNQASIEITREWNALGMRGTCSHACELSAEVESVQVVATPFEQIANQGMIPDAHLIWSAIWLGIAQDAFMKAKQVARKQFAYANGGVDGSARLLTKMRADLQSLEAQIAHVATAYLTFCKTNDEKSLRSADFAVRVNGLKLNASEISVNVCLMALEVCGIAGYKNDDELSVARHIRDVLSARVMVSNERLIQVNAARLMI